MKVLFIKKIEEVTAKKKVAVTATTFTADGVVYPASSVVAAYGKTLLVEKWEGVGEVDGLTDNKGILVADIGGNEVSLPNPAAFYIAELDLGEDADDEEEDEEEEEEPVRKSAKSKKTSKKTSKKSTKKSKKVVEDEDDDDDDDDLLFDDEDEDDDDMLDLDEDEDEDEDDDDDDEDEDEDDDFDLD